MPLFDTDAMADALEKLARDPDLRGRMGAAGRERILRDFTLDQQIAGFLATYQAVLGDAV